MTNDIAKFVQGIARDAWSSGVDPGSLQSIRWISLFGARDHEYPQIGLSHEAQWVVASVGGVTRISIDSAAWLLALDYSLKELRSIIQRKFGSFSEAADVLPYERIVEHGLEYGNDVGILKAVAWLEEDRGLMTERLKGLLARISYDRKYSQAVRHRALKLVAPLRRHSH